MWTIRVMLLIALGTLVAVDSFLICHRRRYPRLSESRALNIALVAAHLIVMCALVTLPPAGGWGARPHWLQDKGVCLGFATMGAALVGAGIVLASLALQQRKAFGAQSSQEGLLTSHAYRYFRHPIYTGSLWIFLGLALALRNLDGLMVLPAIFLAYLILMLLEERHDLGPAFGRQYQVYRQTTGMFGPVWLWTAILLAILLIAISARIGRRAEEKRAYASATMARNDGWQRQAPACRWSVHMPRPHRQAPRTPLAAATQHRRSQY